MTARRIGAWLEGGSVRWRVWAPDHQRLEVVLYDPNDTGRQIHSLSLTPEPGGYFGGTWSEGTVGALYKFRIDGAGPFPDPGSRSQPLGVHGPSEISSDDFAWTDERWSGVPLEVLVIYEIHVGTATRAGTFDALIPRLAELRALGVTAIELMPLASFPGARNWGYDGVGLYAPAVQYGGGPGLRRLIDSAHAAGLGVLIDCVYNHFGPDGNYLRAFSDRYFTERHKTPWGDAINVDGDGAEPVREFILANAEMWIRDYHADGLRLDAIHAIVDNREPHLLSELVQRAKSAGGTRHVVIIGEDDRNDARVITPAERGGIGLGGLWADDFHHQLRRGFAGDHDGYYADFTGSAADIAVTLRDGWFYQGQRSEHMQRPRGTPVAHVEPARLVHCIQNHDQIGNRALGDRIGASVSPAAFKAMSALLLLSPYTPLIFMGQEWNATTPFQYFTDHEPELGRLVTEGRRSEFKAFSAFAGLAIPDPQSAETFARSKLDWDEREKPEHAAVLQWYRELLGLRTTHPCLLARDRGSFAIRAAGECAVIIERRRGESVVLVIVNIRGTLDESLEAVTALHVLANSDDPRFGGVGADIQVSSKGRVTVHGPGAVVIEAAAIARP